MGTGAGARRRGKRGGEAAGIEACVGYSTDFSGEFELSRHLTAEVVAVVKKFCSERHDVQWFPSDEYNVHGEVVPVGQDSPWCQWAVSEDGKHLAWDGGEKFYSYVEWLEFLIERFFGPWGVEVSGRVEWQGEYDQDVGKIVMLPENAVKVVRGVKKVEYAE